MLNFLLFKFMAVGLSAVRSLLLAALLGPASYGVFGTLIIIQQFLGYAALGIREGTSVALVQTSCVFDEQARVRSSALLWGAGVGLMTTLSCLVLYTFDILNSSYVWVGVIAMMSILNDILTNINRAAEQLSKIAILELFYNVPSIIILLLMWKSVTITAVLMALTVGLTFSVCGHIRSLNLWRDWQPDRATVRRLLTTGLPLAFLSGLILLVNSSLVLLANYKLDQTEIGKVVFAANVCTILMFALNAVAWASTSRSMRTFNVAVNSEMELFRAERMRLAFRFSIVVVTLLALASGWILPMTLPDYTGAEEYILYYCLAQSYCLILFDEINYLIISNRSWRVISGYVLLLIAMFAPALLIPTASFDTLIKFGIASHCILAIVITQHCRVLGGTSKLDHHAKLVFVMFPPLVVALYSVFGKVGVLLICIVFAVIPLKALLTAPIPRSPS
jgi:O-antigen/teichoic acid export membrane protein